MASRFASTTRLSNVIQMVTLSKQSGILRATRGQGPQRELGQVPLHLRRAGVSLTGLAHWRHGALRALELGRMYVPV